MSGQSSSLRSWCLPHWYGRSVMKMLVLIGILSLVFLAVLVLFL